ncbi:MAG: hypothetical protein ACR2H1_13095 [Limisphaerales bacterium]
MFFKNATASQVTAARALVETDLKSGVLLSVGTDWNKIFEQATKLAEQHTGTVGCRSLDILHCAAAKIIFAKEFITTDHRQKHLAKAMGLNLIVI